MTDHREPAQDPDLPLFPPPERLVEPGRVEPTLAIASPASGRPFRLEGERITLCGHQRGPVSSIHVDGVRVVAWLEADAGVVANTVLSPGRLRRERLGAGGSVQETLLVAPSLPLTVLHWSGAADVSLRLLPDARQVRYHIREGLATATDDGAQRMLALALSPAGASWTSEPGADGGLLLRAGGGGGPRTLLIAYGTPAAIQTAFKAASHLTAHEARAVTGVRDVLELRSGAGELDEAVAWMSARLRHGVLRGDSDTDGPNGPRESEAWTWAGLGCVAVGDSDGALRCIRRLRRAEAPLAAALVAGRLALTTGHLEAAQESVAALMSGPGGEGPDRALAMLARRTVADGLRYGATPETLARLREGATAAPTGGGSGRRLPTVDRSPPASGIGVWLAGLLEPTGGAPQPRMGGSEARPEEITGGLRAWGEIAAGATAGWASWRALVHEGMNGDHGGAAWDEVFAPPAVTGILLAGLAHGWLGAFPDAPVGRLALTPRIPEHLSKFEVAGIPVGDARITMRYERRDRRRGFTFAIDYGRVPPFLVFATTVPHPVGRVLLDGSPIDPDLERHDAGTTVRLQTSLDARRLLEIEPA